MTTHESAPSSSTAEWPAGLEEYKRTPLFDESSVPAGLLRNHSLKANTWGQIVVLKGRVSYFIGTPPKTQQLSPEQPGMVRPTQVHHIEVHPNTQFYVRFLRAPR